MTATERMYKKLEQDGQKAADLCRFLNISSSLMVSWKEIPPSKYLLNISKFLNVTTDWLLSGEGEMSPPERQLPAQRHSPWVLTPEQLQTARLCFPELTEEQVALLNNFAKLPFKDRNEVKQIIEMKLELNGGAEFSSSANGEKASGIA